MTAQQPRLSSSSPRRHPRLREPKHPTTHLLDLSYLSQFPQRSLVVHSVSQKLCNCGPCPVVLHSCSKFFRFNDE